MFDVQKSIYDDETAKGNQKFVREIVFIDRQCIML